MSLFTHFFRNEKRAEPVVLIDIGTDSVAGAYAKYSESQKPVLFYTKRIPISVRDGEPHEDAMLRALKALGSALIIEGAPILIRSSGSGSANTILVSIDAPWQKTSVRTEHFEKKISFIFTKSMVSMALEKTGTAPRGMLLADESIIGTVLNGYQTHDPYGKRVHRASIIILTSFIDEQVAASIATTLQGLYHTSHILFIAGSSLRYQAMRVAFPHERDALILDATGSVTSIALVRENLFVALAEVESTTHMRERVHNIAHELSILAQRYPLPRIVFLLAKESKILSLQKMLGTLPPGTLWLSDNPPKIVSVLPSHMSGLIHQITTMPPDLQLFLMTLFWQYHAAEEAR